MKAAKQHILTRAIATASPPVSSSSSGRTISGGRPGQLAPPRRQPQPASLPEPLLDLLLILPPLLDQKSPPLARDSAALLFSSPPLSDLESLLPDLADLLSSHLRSSALNLARISNPSTNPSYLHRHIPSLATSFSALVDSQTTAHESLAAARLATLSSVITLLESYSASVTRLIRALEVKHGVVARSLDLRAAESSLRAQHTHAAVQMALHNGRARIYTPEASAALGSYASHLRDARTRADERVKGLRAELAEYGVGVGQARGEGKEKTMREMARVYREMSRQMEDAQGDLARLKRG